jgi:5-methylcytosine-specific restriction endonuclease McrA
VRPRKHLPDGSINPLWQPVGRTRKTTPVPAVDPRAAPLVQPPFPCANCDAPVVDAQLYCRQLCRDEAKYVRYYRASIADNSIVGPDVRDALRIRLAHLLSGGYDARLRQLSLEVRRAVFERDEFRCRRCGDQGTEVDHVRGSSNELANLQLLCSPCHREKTTRSFQRISRKSHPEEWTKAEALRARVENDEPVRLCDEEQWSQLWRTVAMARRRALALITPA